LFPFYYQKSNAAIVFYDITDSASFERAKEAVEELKIKVSRDDSLLHSLMGALVRKSSE
jgi:GTPase SAR1 family protein